MAHMPDSPSVARELVAHSGALRRLARDLVGSTDAEDLVQDTAVRALCSPPPAPHGLFSWLSTVMHHLAANRRRGEQRRRQREAAAGGGGEGPAADAEAAQRDAVRAVTDALWALPEPYQGTLVQRYFEELSPAQIAARAGVPLPTVKSRLQRGLELLRQALERREGRAWRAAIAPAFGLGVRSSWLLSALSMSTLAKPVAVAALCTIAAFTWWGSLAGEAPPAAAVFANANERAGSPIAAANDETLAADRAMVAAEASLALELAQPFAFELRARVVDADGVPFGGGHVAISPPDCALALSEPMDAEGRVTVTWRARVSSLTMAVGFAHQGSHTSLQQVTLAAGVPAEVHFVAGIAPLPAQVRVDEFGRQVVTMPDCSRGNADCRSCHEGLKGANLFEARGALRAGLHPDAVFGDRLAIPPENPAGPELTLDDLTSFGMGAPSASKRSIAGRVFGADGQPVAGIRVGARREGFASVVLTQADGSFLLPGGTESGAVELRAGGGPEGLATRTIERVEERMTVPDLILETGRTLRGRALDSSGKNLNGARVEYVAPPGHDGDVATVGPDGRFAFANLPPGAGRLLLWGVHGETLPIAEEPSVLPDGGEVVFDLRQRPAAKGSLRVFVSGHDGGRARDVEVRAWQVQTKRGAFLERRDERTYHAPGLTAGFYRLEVGALASGFRDLGQHWVDGTAMADLGTVQLATPATLVLEGRKADDELEIYARRDGLDVRADYLAPWTRELLLPPGSWLVLWKHDGKLVMRELTLTVAAATTLNVAR